MRGSLDIDLAGERLTLLPERAVWWPGRHTLLAADLHWGKDEAFRAAGLPIPAGGLAADLARLTDILEQVKADRLLILGDLWHSREGITDSVLEAVVAWRAAHQGLAIELVQGNHDARAGPPSAALHMTEQLGDLAEGPFIFRHYPAVLEEGYVLAGHVHPAVTLRGVRRERLRLPAFWFTERVGILPSFGSFTGSGDVQPGPADGVFVVADGEVVRVG